MPQVLQTRPVAADPAGSSLSFFSLAFFYRVSPCGPMEALWHCGCLLQRTHDTQTLTLARTRATRGATLLSAKSQSRSGHTTTHHTSTGHSHRTTLLSAKSRQQDTSQTTRQLPGPPVRLRLGSALCLPSHSGYGLGSAGRPPCWALPAGRPVPPAGVAMLHRDSCVTCHSLHTVRNL
jgi:hypothetical protein